MLKRICNYSMFHNNEINFIERKYRGLYNSFKELLPEKEKQVSIYFRANDYEGLPEISPLVKRWPKTLFPEIAIFKPTAIKDMDSTDANYRAVEYYDVLINVHKLVK